MRTCRVVLSLLALLALILQPTALDAQSAFYSISSSGGSGAAFCPFGNVNTLSGNSDGCQAAQTLAQGGLTGSWKQTNCFASGGWLNQVTGTTTNYSSQRLSWNRPGCDYPIGAQAASSLLDVASHVPTGCTYSPTGSTHGNPLLTCNTSWTGMSGLRFDAVNGHGCVALALPNSIPGGAGAVATISNVLFQDDGNCEQITGAIVDGGGTQNYELDFTSVTFRGRGVAARNDPFPAGMALTANGVVKLNYVAIEDFFQRTMGFGTVAGSGSLSITNSVVAGWAYFDPAAHGEIVVATEGGSFNFVNDLFIQKTAAQAFGQAAPFPTNLTTAAPVPVLDAEDNVVINSFAGGATHTASVTGCIGGLPPTSGVCDTTTPGSTFYATTVTGGTIGSGEGLSCARSGAVELSTSISGGTSAGIGGGFNGGSGSVWGIDTEGGITGLVGSISGTTLTITTAGNAIMAPGYVLTEGSGGSTALTANTTIVSVGTIDATEVGTYTVSQSQAVSSEPLQVTTILNPLAGGWALAPQSCTASMTSVTVGDAAFLWPQNADPIGQSQVSYNMIDMQATPTSAPYEMGDPNSNCTIPIVMTGNFDPSGTVSSTVMNEMSIGSGGDAGCNP